MSDAYFRHPQALVESRDIGAATRIWAFAHILPGARVGAECNICDGVFIENDVIVGDRVTVKCGVQLWDGVRLEDDVFVGPNATFTNDRFPRSTQRPRIFPHTLVRQGASIGANATVLPGITIGKRAMVGAGSVVTRDVPTDAIVLGNPARVVGYVAVNEPPVAQATGSSAASLATNAGAGQLFRLPEFRDLRGSLCVAELGTELPFSPQRVFIVHDVPGKEVRGAHAHRTLHQFLICVGGACSVVTDDGNARQEHRLDRHAMGLYVPAGVWALQYGFTPQASLVVLASAPYDPDDYIRDYDDFLAWRSEQSAGTKVPRGS